jgi:hypothetical protein
MTDLLTHLSKPSPLPLYASGCTILLYLVLCLLGLAECLAHARCSGRERKEGKKGGRKEGRETGIKKYVSHEQAFKLVFRAVEELREPEVRVCPVLRE